MVKFVNRFFLCELWKVYISHIETYEQIFTHKIWKFSSFIWGKMGLDILHKCVEFFLCFLIYWCLFYHTKCEFSIFHISNLDTHFQHEIRNTPYITYENLSSSFTTWNWILCISHMKRCLLQDLEFLYFRRQNLCNNGTNKSLKNLYILHMKLMMMMLTN